MKKTRFSLGALASAIALTTTSCFDTDPTEVEFYVNVSGYIRQVVKEDSTAGFIPYLAMVSNAAEFKIKSAEMYSAKNNFETEKVNDYVFQTTESKVYDTPEELAGTYTFNATAETGERHTSQLELKATSKDTISAVAPTELKYDREIIKVELPEPKGAVAVGIAIVPYNDGETPKRSSTTYMTAQNVSIRKDTLSFSINFPNRQLGDDHAVLYVFATSQQGIFRESDKRIVIDKIKTEEEN